MGNSRPFVLDLLVVNDAFAVIVFVELIINFAQAFFGERFACFRFRVRDLFKFRKLRLTEQGGANAVHVVVEKVLLQILVRGLFVEVL